MSAVLFAMDGFIHFPKSCSLFGIIPNTANKINMITFWRADDFGKCFYPATTNQFILQVAILLKKYFLLAKKWRTLFIKLISCPTFQEESWYFHCKIFYPTAHYLYKVWNCKEKFSKFHHIFVESEVLRSDKKFSC